MNNLKNLRVLVADDEEFTQIMLQQLLSSEGYEVKSVGTVSDALTSVADYDPHVVIADLNFGPGPTGADLLNRIYQDSPWIGLVILTSHSSPELAVASAGDIPKHAIYLVKSQLRSIETISEAITSSLASSDPFIYAERDDSGLIPISDAQAEVLRLMAQGLTNSAIAEKRNTTLRATEGLIQRTFLALGITDESDHNPRVIAARMWQQGKVVVK